MSKILFGPRLKALRLQSPTPAAANFAKAVGISRATLYLWEGADDPPPAKHWPQLCAVLGISQQHLLMGAPEASGKFDSVVEENLTRYDSLDLASKAWEEFSRLLKAAQNDQSRLGWILEQMRLHLAIPAHWTPLEKNETPEEMKTRLGAEITARAHEQLREEISTAGSYTKPRPSKTRKN